MLHLMNLKSQSVFADLPIDSLAQRLIDSGVELLFDDKGKLEKLKYNNKEMFLPNAIDCANRVKTVFKIEI